MDSHRTRLYLDLIATDIHGERMNVSHLKYDEVAEILGVWMAPDRNKKHDIIAKIKSIRIGS